MRLKDVMIRGPAILLMGVVMAGGAARAAGVVYSNDFETNTNGFDRTETFALPSTGNPATPLSTFLGRFGNDTATLSLSGLTAGRAYEVRFDLFIGATWDGNYPGWGGPDVFRLTAGATPLVDATFGHSPAPGDPLLLQSYSDATPLGGPAYAAAYPGRTGADVDYFSPNTIFENYSIYYFGHGAGNPYLTFIASGATETLTFQGLNLQGVGDEFWAIDNVAVSAVPEPSSIALSLIGLAAAGLYGRRRARG